MQCVAARSHWSSPGELARPEDPPSTVKPAGHGAIRGVNIGGVFLIEAFIKPSLFDQFSHMSDAEMPELGKEEAKRQLEEHWDTFVTRDHLEKLVEVGINWIRIPVGYWAFNLTREEPYVDGQLPYIERMLGWSRDLGLKVQLDLHGVPGSQNGFDNSGRRGNTTWLDQRVNIDRAMDVLTKLADMANKWPDVVYAIEAINEPSKYSTPLEKVRSFYEEAYTTVRNIAPDLMFMTHDTFADTYEWNVLVNTTWENHVMDSHLYQMFNEWVVTFNESTHINLVYDTAKNITIFDNTTRRVVVGEFSPNCPTTNCTCTGNYGSDYTQFTDEYKAFLKNYMDAQLDVYDGQLLGWFYWNFRTEGAPEWDYLLGVEQGWIPKFPRTAFPKGSDNSAGSSSSAEHGFVLQSIGILALAILVLF
ncbi:glycoside hydrolase [Linderina pennispora]|uniref:glucan 1,3-beta-glucosidase n=1 Tax=Linderina pennispora TaxID=61395 RepID=A0A1Y1WJ06_9FUNG|nr:glycoside hydrolase [Linderina pennispora]ORX73345.1 glycoside hydrolase [Linderina pennispora]